MGNDFRRLLTVQQSADESARTRTYARTHRHKTYKTTKCSVRQIRFARKNVEVLGIQDHP